MMQLAGAKVKEVNKKLPPDATFSNPLWLNLVKALFTDFH